jgi:glycosyltransferase involved in cell wall biosynthesis
MLWRATRGCNLNRDPQGLRERSLKVSVVIPTYNSERTIRPAIDSVLAQTIAPYEVIVLDDGSTDGTVSILQSYGSRITLLRQENSGVASARNTMCEKAQGDLIAFLDHDDVWHARYLEIQHENAMRYPEAVAYFTGHINFYGYKTFEWPSLQQDDPPAELIAPAAFLARYCARPSPFASVSYLCVPKDVLRRIRDEPFHVDGADDSYLCTLFPLLGSVIYTPAPLVAYRFTEDAQSSDSLKMDRLRTEVLELLEPKFKTKGSADLYALFAMAFASKRRQYAKRLLGVGRKVEARSQLRASFTHSRSLASAAKSAGLLAASYMPNRLHPAWPGAHREWRGARVRHLTQRRREPVTPLGEESPE